MVERRPWLNAFTHVMLIAGVAIIALPVYVAFVASTLSLEQTLEIPMSLVPGTHLLDNYATVLTHGSAQGSSAAPASGT